MRRVIGPAALTAAILSAGPAFAHPGAAHVHGFADGFLHPMSGVDHILAMVAVGLFAAQLGGRALWLVPSAFVALMAAGGVLGISGVGLPWVEVGIAASVIVLGLALALQLSPPVGVAMGLAGFLAIFHGHAHGAEMPPDASGLGYALGFMLATATLHAIGIGLGLGVGLAGKRTASPFVRVGGALMAFAGVGLLTGWM